MNAKPFVAAALTIAAGLIASPSQAASKEEAAVLAPVQAMFDGMAKYDQAAMLAAVQPEGSVALLRDGKMVRMTLGNFIGKIKASPKRIEERIYDPLVRIDGDIAMVWAPYDFRVDGQVKHCGTDIVNLVRVEGRWLVAGIADNSRDNCPAR